MKYFRKFILFSVLSIPLGLPFLHDGFRELSTIGWYILIGIMLIRPLADVFPDFKWFRKLVPLRKEFGILSAVLILSHAYGYFLEYKLNIVTELSTPSYWAYSGHLFWGTLGAIVAFLLLITSNMIAIRILKKWWKPLQRIAYLFFILGGIHIVLVNTSYFPTVGLQMTIVSIFWILAEFKIRVRWKTPNQQL